jgi:hypothetical protein
MKRIIRLFLIVVAGLIIGCGDDIADEEDGGSDTGAPYPVALAAGYYFTCAINSDKAIECWGCNGLNFESPTEGAFTMIAAGGHHACALREDGKVICWWSPCFYPEEVPYDVTAVPDDLVAEQITSSCAVTQDDGSIVCWGWSAGWNPPTGTGYLEVSLSEDSVCALAADHSIDVWGDCGNNANVDEPCVPPEGNDFEKISSPCSIKSDGSIVCWAVSGPLAENAPPVGNDFVNIDSRVYRACAVRQNGSLACWGNDEFGESTPPTGNDFVRVSCGALHTCALKKDNTVMCWGNNDYGQCDPPY